MAAGKSILIETKDLGREFKTGNETVHALIGCDLKIKKGDFTIFEGPSGSGKTTMMNILGALDRPTAGGVFFGDEDIAVWNDGKRDMHRRDNIGFIFQTMALISSMTAYENVDFGMRIAGVRFKERDLRIKECLDMVGLKDRMAHFPHELSGGEQQRVAIARAIAHKPQMILADEPTSDLDSKTGLQVIKLFKDLISNEGVSIIMTSHNPGIIDLGDAVFAFNDGAVKKMIKEEKR